MHKPFIPPVPGNYTVTSCGTGLCPLGGYRSAAASSRQACTGAGGQANPGAAHSFILSCSAKYLQHQSLFPWSFLFYTYSTCKKNKKNLWAGSLNSVNAQARCVYGGGQPLWRAGRCPEAYAHVGVHRAAAAVGFLQPSKLTELMKGDLKTQTWSFR